MRKLPILAATAIAVTALAATSPAKAAYSIIKWDVSGVCQVWDTAFPTPPLSTTVKMRGPAIASFMDALAARDSMVRSRKCAF